MAAICGVAACWSRLGTLSASSRTPDLHGGGIPGILAERGGAWFYKRNLSLMNVKSDTGAGHTNAKCASVAPVAVKPSRALADGQFRILSWNNQVTQKMYSREASRLAKDDTGRSSSAVPEAVCVRLLGGFQVSVGTITFGEGEWRLKKARNLIKLLALAPRHCLHREWVMDSLWPELAPKAAANNLRYALHNARRTLKPALPDGSRSLRLRSDQLALCPEGHLWVDVESFEEAAAMARRARNPAAYEAAIRAYTGDLLPEDRYEDWAEGRREELRTTYLVLLLELARLREERAELEPAIEALRLVLKSEPDHNETHAGLMRLYALSGQRQAALRQYEQLRETLWRNLGTEPDVTERCLYEEIVAGRYPSARLLQKPCSREEPAGGRQHNLPAARTGLIGRERELVEIKRALGMTRLLTLTGVCGSGKTRLALEVAGALTDVYSDGVWLTELATLWEETQVPKAVAAALRLREQPGHTLVDTLVDYLRNRKMLLVLDNCEHLIDYVAHLVDTFLNSCPHLRVLATSREALGVAGEAKWLVPPLSLPDSRQTPTVENVARFESVRLFVERARSHHLGFALTPRKVMSVVGICRQLDGNPLAIELAAARVGVLSTEQIVARLEDSLKLLNSGSRTAPSRQQTLRGALDWSYDLLTDSERRLFQRLSVFAGGWTLEAAEAVAAGDGIDEDHVLDLLSRLVTKSLVLAEQSEDETLRYRMLKPVHQYGLERLQENGEPDTVRRRHIAFFLELAEVAEPELRGAQQEAWLGRLEREHSNLRAALGWVLARGEIGLALRLAGALGEFWHVRGRLNEGRRWLEAALAKGDALPVSARAKALAPAGCIAWEQGDYERSIAFSEESLALSRKLEDMVGATAALSNLAWAALYQNELRRASKLAEEAMTLQRVSADTGGIVHSLLILGMVAAVQRDYDRALALHEESLALAREVEDNFAIVLSLALGAFVSLSQGHYEQARNCCAEGLELSQRLGMGQMIATHLHISAALAGSQGQWVNSARLWGAAEALREELGTVLSPVERYVYEPYISTAYAELEETACRAAWAEGRAMTLEEAVEYALSKEEPAPLSASTPEKASVGEPLDALAPREWDVAHLIARGLTNRQIAKELVISEHTVATHVSRILRKLELHSRAQLAASVVEQQLLLSSDQA
jgi:predicted ATPase/DNA-binding SARP family transcriptional activator/DNA-binding CsgD family transcriptional regulator